MNAFRNGTSSNEKVNPKGDRERFDVAVIGSGPYGLSSAAYLKAEGFKVRVFGEPMTFWADKMPEGMLLRSPRVASTIADPKSAWTLEAFEAATGTAPVAPLPLKTFVAYGRWFQGHLATEVDSRTVVEVRQENSGFHLTLDSGAGLHCQRVVVAAGIGPFQRKPNAFKDIPSTFASHCYEGARVGEFAGKAVAVIGAGQSALESAALIAEAGGNVEIIARLPILRWIGQHPWLHRLGPISKLLYSEHDVGPAGISRLVAAPTVVAKLPIGLRDKIRKRAVRPAGSQWLRPRLSSVQVTNGRTVQSAVLAGDKVRLELDDGTTRMVDHVLMGTGYDVDIERYNFLSPDLLARIDRLDGYPQLGPGFTTSVSGLHFIGATAARSFGPLLYFVAGTKFASTHLTRHLRREPRT